MRQPAMANCITVAWPMPRLAPVSSMTGRLPASVFGKSNVGIAIELESLRVEARLGPRLAGRVATEDDAIVQAEGAVAPELDIDRGDAKATPIGWARNLAE